MNRETEKAAKEQTGAGPQIVDLRARVPQMTDPALATLLDNARRLLEAGSKVQRSMATELIPVIEGELAQRRAAKAATQATKKVSVKKQKAAASG